MVMTRRVDVCTIKKKNLRVLLKYTGLQVFKRNKEKAKDHCLFFFSLESCFSQRRAFCRSFRTGQPVGGLIRAPCSRVTPLPHPRQGSHKMASLGPLRTIYVVLLSLKGTMDTDSCAHSHSTTLGWGFQLARRHCRCISHKRTWVKSEPDKSRVLSGLCPACSCHLPGQWGEDEGDRREFMTYPSSHRGALRHSEVKHMGRRRRKK